MALMSLLQPTNRKFMQGMQAYVPTDEIARVRVPVLIVQGGRDIQITEADAQALATAQLAAKLQIFPTANHVLKAATASDQMSQLPLYLDPNTKLFLVALMWCRPWLIDPGRGTPLPRTPEIARAALEVTDAHHEIECFDTDPAFRDRLSARVGEHLKVLRRKIVERGLVREGIRLSDEVAVGVLIENGTIAADDLARLSDPAWCSRQEDLWWTQVM